MGAMEERGINIYKQPWSPLGKRSVSFSPIKIPTVLLQKLGFVVKTAEHNTSEYILDNSLYGL